MIEEDGIRRTLDGEIQIRILQNVGAMGISFNDLDEESGDLVSGFVMQATSLDQ